MGRLIETLKRKAYRQSCATRYWYMDTKSGDDARKVIACVSALVVVFQTVRMAMAVVKPAPAYEPQHMIVWWVVMLIISVVAALIVYATMPKVEPPKPTEGEGMTVEDGRSIPEIHGTVWIKEQFGLANKIVGLVPIKSDSKK